jgi:hypothetical protein
LYAHQTAFGGNTDEWVFVSLIPNLAEIDKGPPLVRGLGPEGMQKLGAKLGEVVASVEYRILRFNTELSYQGTASASTNE